MKLEFQGQRKPEDVMYMQEMLDALKERPRKPLPQCPEGMTRDEWILSMQPESTKRVLSGEAEKMPWPPLFWKAVPDAKTLDEAVGMRNISIEEFILIDGMRKNSKNTLGQSEISATTPARRESAIQGFIYSPPADVTKDEVLKKATGLVAYKTQPPAEVWVKIPWYKALIHRWLGGEVKQQLETKRLSKFEDL